MTIKTWSCDNPAYLAPSYPISRSHVAPETQSYLILGSNSRSKFTNHVACNGALRQHAFYKVKSMPIIIVTAPCMYGTTRYRYICRGDPFEVKSKLAADPDIGCHSAAMNLPSACLHKAIDIFHDVNAL